LWYNIGINESGKSSANSVGGAYPPPPLNPDRRVKTMIVKAFKNGKEIAIDNLVGNVRIIYKCDDCGSEQQTSWYALKRKNRIEKQYCRKCTIKRDNVIEKRKATCVKKYGADNPMKVKELADKHHKSDTQKKTRLNLDLIKKSFSDEGYTLLTTEYKHRMQKLDFICPNGHKYYITWSSWQRGSRCLLCSYKENAINKRQTLETILAAFKESNTKLISTEYKNNKTKLLVECENGHEYQIKWNSFQQGHRCPYCSHHKSRAELEIFGIIQEHFPDAISGDRELIGPLELDIVIPSKKTAIEYCGLFWHSEAQGKNKYYHLDKLEQCNKAGYNLITIFEDEWYNKSSIVLSRLFYKLGISDAERIHARKCKICEIPAKIKNEFLDQHHIQGKDSASIKLGAFYEDKLVSVMTFGKPNLSRKSKHEWELNRFVSHSDYIIPGIASKLFMYFVRNWRPDNIITYSDRRWSGDAFYTKLGFRKSHNSNPNYWYIVDNNRLHRYNFRKSVLKKKLEFFDADKTEVQNMYDNNFTRIFDCGNTVWVWNVTNNNLKG